MQRRAAHREQTGVALLAFLILVVLSASTLLLTRLNAGIRPQGWDPRTMQALNQAKQALIGYAAAYPDKPDTTQADAGPGYLPCPDTDNDGAAGKAGSPTDGCGANPPIRRLPWKTLELDDLRDGSGERLWYAVSPKFRGGVSPKYVPLNSETPGQLSVDGQSDVVAIVFSPGGVLTAQSRSSANQNDVTQYLEGGNENGDALFVSTAGVPFNDTLMVISQRDIVLAMERRVLGEVRKYLLRYRKAFGYDAVTDPTNATPNDNTFPWLSPFADPRLARPAKPVLEGRTTSGPSATVLTDSAKNFNNYGLRPGSIVHNLTDGSSGTAASIGVPPDTLTVARLTGGRNNQFASGDEYRIVPLLQNVAGAASSGLTLKDTTAAFSTVGVNVGDVIENLTDNSRGLIESVTGTDIKAVSLIGGVNSFSSGNEYRIRTNVGTARAGSTGTTLIDTLVGNEFRTDTGTARDFLGLKPQNGMLVQNVTKGGIGYISSVGNTALAVNSLLSGDAFANNDTYLVPQFNGVPNTRYGWLPFHQPGEAFPTGFTVNWTTSGGALPPDWPLGAPTSPDPTSVVQDISVQPTSSGNFSVSALDGACVWIRVDFVRCHAKFEPEPFFGGTATSGTGGSGGRELRDSSLAFDFEQWEVRAGDIAIDLTNGGKGVVQSVNGDRIEVSALRDNLGNTVSFAQGDNYRIKMATNRINGTMDAGTAGTTLVDSSVDFIARGVQVGDTVRDLDTDATGFIAGVATNSIAVTFLDDDGSPAAFSPGDDYRVRSRFAEKRRVEIAMEGTATPSSVSGEKRRTVSNAQNPSRLRIHYYDASSNLLVTAKHGLSSASSVSNIRMDMAPLAGTADSSIPANGNPVTLSDAGLDFLLWNVKLGDWVENIYATSDRAARVTQVNQHSLVIDAPAGAQFAISAGDTYRVHTDLPPWFFSNDWHRLVYVVDSNQLVPGGTGACTAGANCLNMTAVSPGNDKAAIVIVAGKPIGTQDRTIPNAATLRSRYFELQNSDTPPNETYEGIRFDNNYNDQVEIVLP